jgi:diphthine synthase
MVIANTIHNLRQKDFGPPLHTIVIPGNLHFMEIEALELCADLPLELKTKIQKL